MILPSPPPPPSPGLHRPREEEGIKLIQSGRGRGTCKMERQFCSSLRVTLFCAILILNAVHIMSVRLRGPSHVIATDVDQPIIAGGDRSFTPLADTKFSNSYWESRQAEYKEAPFKATLSDASITKDDDCDNLKTTKYTCHKKAPRVSPPPAAPARATPPPTPAPVAPKPAPKKPELEPQQIEAAGDKELRDNAANAQAIATKQIGGTLSFLPAHFNPTYIDTALQQRCKKSRPSRRPSL